MKKDYREILGDNDSITYVVCKRKSFLYHHCGEPMIKLVRYKDSLHCKVHNNKKFDGYSFICSCDDCNYGLGIKGSRD
jgi:hypothetical protein